MNKVRVFSCIVGAFAVLSLTACNAIMGLQSKDGPDQLGSVQTSFVEDLSSDLGALSEGVKMKLKNYMLPNPDVNLSDYYTQSYIDSLRAVLLETGSLKINTFESFLVKHLKSSVKKDTLYLTNLYVNSPTKGEVKSYEFNVKKGDVIFYEITNTKANALKEISILEGGEIRFVKNNLKKKQTVKGEIKIVADNVLTVNISNDNFIKNKGLFKSKLKIVMKKIVPELKLKAEIKQDTIVTSKPFIEEVNDTIYKVIDSKNFTLGPRLDLTRSYQQVFNVNIAGFDHLIGWGYWIGLDKASIAQFQEMAAKENPLLIFAKNELRKVLRTIELDVNENNDVELLIKNQSLDARSYNYASNFAFYKSDAFTTKNVKKAEVYFTNNSTLYEYDVSYNVVAVGLTKIKNEIMKDMVAYKDYIHITLLKDE